MDWIFLITQAEQGNFRLVTYESNSFSRNINFRLPKKGPDIQLFWLKAGTSITT
jgi:hypothetical protein